MSMSREEAMREEYDRRCTDRRSLSFPGKLGESPDDWPYYGPTDDRESAQPVLAITGKDGTNG